MLKSRIKAATILIVIISTLAFMSSCGKDNKTGALEIRMKDAPGDFQQVNVEILRVQVHCEAEGWVSVPTNAGVYDLLELQNDVNVVLTDGDQFPVGKVNQLRLILGDDNSVLVDDVYYNLALSSEDKTGIKINIDQMIESDQTLMLLLDFDAHKSIVIEGNGIYRLKPVIQLDKVVYL